MEDESWKQAMKELDQFERNQLWTLIERPKNCSVIRIKWVFRNKLNEDGKVICNKAILVAQGYPKQKGIDYDETFAQVASGELETLVMGSRIIINELLFVDLFETKFFGVIPYMNGVCLDDSEVSLEGAKNVVAKPSADLSDF
ncbi:uncharacterized mitochondrial protein AtMg00820-like [Solanum tuberosum]|uniref:uncharacterized mitochondrial protein AtMg00820-like n=1 Tax=Solanum tuberosum TaxID=4113 RepID=UPI00073A1CD4|nr:PREDICTED: uncharacterized mitochondrial protein AtMg00820-like [Solanum tuberosum]